MGNRQKGEKMRQEVGGEAGGEGEGKEAGNDEINGGERGEGAEADLSKSCVTLVRRTRFCFHYL